LRMPLRTNDWSNNSRWRGGKPWRFASVLAEIGRPSVCNDTSSCPQGRANRLGRWPRPPRR
jgi:hypothetical protein